MVQLIEAAAASKPEHVVVNIPDANALGPHTCCMRQARMLRYAQYDTFSLRFTFVHGLSG
jgi:hypothetical protein